MSHIARVNQCPTLLLVCVAVGDLKTVVWVGLILNCLGPGHWKCSQNWTCRWWLKIFLVEPVVICEKGFSSWVRLKIRKGGLFDIHYGTAVVIVKYWNLIVNSWCEGESGCKFVLFCSGTLSPENLQKYSMEALNTTQVYAVWTYDWVCQKVQTLSKIQ